MDKIFIQDLRIRTIIGVLPHERKHPQLVVISVEIFFRGEAKSTDTISDALDYDAICKHTVELVKKTRFRLIEKLVEEVAQSIIKKFGAKKVNVRLTKPNALKHTSDVGIQISRENHDSN